MKDKVVITIPIYKSSISKQEQIALLQCNKVLAKYPKTLLAPKNLDVTAYHELLDNLTVKFYNPFYFSGYKGYNKLCLSPFFYKDFQQYEFMLIYQPDCFVFRDELLDWCAKDYDYIGAPWLKQIPFREDKKVFMNLSKFLLGKVGNGGFSLRKISTMINLSKWGLRLWKIWPKNEDFYWSVIIPFFAKNFKRPTVQEALGFAFECFPKQCYEQNNRQLPFGCHAWEKYEPEFWKAFISTT